MQFNRSQVHFQDCGTGSNCSPPRSGGCGCSAAGQSDRGAHQHHSARWLIGADVGIQLRSPVGGSTATCAKLNTAAAGWSPVVITVPTGQDLRINLTNSLSFATGSGTNDIPTSLTIVGQVGGGLGDVNQRTTTASPTHGPQTPTWPAASSDPGDGVKSAPCKGHACSRSRPKLRSGATTALNCWRPPRGHLSA